MAVGHRKLQHITRDMIYGWILTWRQMPQPKPTLKNYIKQQLDSIDPNLATTMVDTSQRDDYADDEVPFLQIIADDIKSYG